MNWELVVLLLTLAGAGLWWFGVGSGRDWDIVGALVVGMAVIIGFGLWFAEATCERYEAQVQRNTEWFVVGGCYVTLSNGRSVPIDEESLPFLLVILDE